MHLTVDVALTALDAGNAEEQTRRFATDRHESEPAVFAAVGSHKGRSADRATGRVTILFDAEDDHAFEVFGANVTVASDAERAML
jgi:hypothetical protein